MPSKFKQGQCFHSTERARRCRNVTSHWLQTHSWLLDARLKSLDSVHQKQRIIEVRAHFQSSSNLDPLRAQPRPIKRSFHVQDTSKKKKKSKSKWVGWYTKPISSSGHLIIPSNLAGFTQESPIGLQKTAEDDA